MKIVAIIPAFNEEKRILSSVLDAGNFVDAVVVVDDCSSDGTSKVALKARAYVLRHEINRGQGAALQTGTDYALQVLGAEIIVHFDADGQMQGSDIKHMVEPVLKGEVDVVLGSRFLGAKSNMPASRRVTLILALWFTRLVSGIKITDTHNGFRVLSKYAAENIRITLDRMAHASEILDLIKLKEMRFVERPVTIKYTDETLKKGQSFMSGFVVLKDFLKSKFIDEL